MTPRVPAAAAAAAVSAAAALSLVLCISLAPSITIFQTDEEAEGSLLSRRVRSSTHKHEYCCQMPWNQSYNDIFIRCEVLNESQTGPYTFEWKRESPMPNFAFAALCPEEDASKAPPDDSDESSDENDKCLDSPYGDCESQCVYKELDVLDAENRPIKEKLNNVMFHMLNCDDRFKDPVHHAANSCMKKYNRALKDFGNNRMDSCAAMMMLGYCMDYEVAKYCPRDCQSELNENRECE